MEIQLKRLRKEAGYKFRRDFVDALGGDYSERQVKAWEIGEHMMSLAQACRVADVLGCSLDELAGRDFRPPASADPLTAPERCLLANYRAASPSGRAAIDSTSQALAEQSGDGPGASVLPERKAG